MDSLRELFLIPIHDDGSIVFSYLDLIKKISRGFVQNDMHSLVFARLEVEL